MFVCLDHVFDPESGWCSKCGRTRRDGFVISTGGHVLQRPPKSHAENLLDLLETEN